MTQAGKGTANQHRRPRTRRHGQATVQAVNDLDGATTSSGRSTRSSGSPSRLALASRKPKEVHIARIRRFSNGVLGNDIDNARLVAAAQRDFPQNFVKALREHKVDDGELSIKVRWMSWTPAHDTWEPAHNLAEDVPDILQRYLRAHQDDAVCAATLKQYFD